MQGGQPYLQAQINQQLDDHACDTLRFAPEQRVHGTAIKPEAGGAGPAALAGAMNFRPTCCYRKFTLVSVWSPSSRKWPEHAKDASIAPQVCVKRAQNPDNGAPAHCEKIVVESMAASRHAVRRSRERYRTCKGRVFDAVAGTEWCRPRTAQFVPKSCGRMLSQVLTHGAPDWTARRGRPACPTMVQQTVR